MSIKKRKETVKERRTKRAELLLTVIPILLFCFSQQGISGTNETVISMEEEIRRPSHAIGQHHSELVDNENRGTLQRVVEERETDPSCVSLLRRAATECYEGVKFCVRDIYRAAIPYLPVVLAFYIGGKVGQQYSPNNRGE